MPLADALTRLKAAAEATRLRILAVLEGAELTVTELTQILGQSQPRVSRHLKLMVDAGLLDRSREGAWAFYRLAETGAGAELAAFLNAGLGAGLDPADKLLEADRQRLRAVRQARREAAAAYFRANAAEWDRIRALYVPEGAVEAAMVSLLGERPIGTFLDLGTGTGRVLEVMGPHIRRGLGFDLSLEMLAIARANLERTGLLHCSVRQGDILRLPLETGRGADAAVLHQVLHFLEDPGAAIAEAARVLTPGGRLLIIDFAPHDLEFLRAAHAHRRLGLAERDMQQWAAEAGLAPVLARELPPRGDAEKLTVRFWLFAAAEPVSPRGLVEVQA